MALRQMSWFLRAVILLIPNDFNFTQWTITLYNKEVTTQRQHMPNPLIAKAKDCVSLSTLTHTTRELDFRQLAKTSDCCYTPYPFQSYKHCSAKHLLTQDMSSIVACVHQPVTQCRKRSSAMLRLFQQLEIS